MGNDSSTEVDPAKLLTEIPDQLKKDYKVYRDALDTATTKHADAAARARTEGGMHLERVPDNAEGNTAQKAGWDALQRLQKDAQDEPEILKALNDYVNGRKVKA